MDNFGEKQEQRKYWHFVTPFLLAAVLLIIIGISLVYLEYYRSVSSSHIFGIVLALCSISLSAVFFSGNRMLINRVKYCHLLVLDAALIVVLVTLVAL